MHSINMFHRDDPLRLENFEGSGADWLEQFKPYIADGQTIVVSPHKVYGPETNDLVLQLRKRNYQKSDSGGHVVKPLRGITLTRVAGTRL